MAAAAARAQVVTVSNLGPIAANDVVVGIRVALADGVRLVSRSSSIVADLQTRERRARTRRVCHTHRTERPNTRADNTHRPKVETGLELVGDMAIGDERSVSLEFAASAAIGDGAAVVNTEAFVSTLVEKTIFIYDDYAKATLYGERRVDFRVSHRC